MKNHVAIATATAVGLGLLMLIILAPGTKPDKTDQGPLDARLQDAAIEDRGDTPAPEDRGLADADGPPAPVRVKLVVATALEEAEYEAYAKAFEQAHRNIKLAVTRKSTDEMVTLLRKQKDDPSFDVIWGVSVTKLIGMQADGLLEPVALDGLDRLSPTFVDPEHQTSGTAHWVGMKALTGAMCIKASSQQVPRRLEDLSKSTYSQKGRGIIMPAPTHSGTGLMFVTSVLGSLGPQRGWQMLDAIHRNVKYYTRSGSAPCKAVEEQGRYEDLVGITLGVTAVATAKRTRETARPIRAAFFETGVPWEIEANALVRQRQIPPAAKTFLQWSISRDAMKVYNEATPATAWAAPLPDPAAGFPIGLKSQLMEKTVAHFTQASGNEADILAEWTRRYGSRVR